MIRVQPDADLASLLNAMLTFSGLSPAELARRSGYAEGQVSRWRHGLVVPSAAVLLRLADAAGFTLTLTPNGGG